MGDDQMTATVSRPELPAVTRQLVEEFGDRIDVATIERVAREEVRLFDRARVREFVAVIAWRLARDRLGSELTRPSVAPPRTNEEALASAHDGSALDRSTV